MSLSKVVCEGLTAFKKISVDFSPVVNVFVGANGTGKTHLMKVAYSACDISKTKMNYAEKLSRVFLSSGRALGRLVKQVFPPPSGFSDSALNDWHLESL
ncbi:MAG: ATP-binding protein [Armatimonadetes bacterium]|nr:ATP-binding protein [Armatimonadota bacterium]